MYDVFQPLYFRLLARKRMLEKLEESGKSVCSHCDYSREYHLPDDRCDSYISSKKFLSKSTCELDTINRVADAIDDLEDLLLMLQQVAPSIWTED